MSNESQCNFENSFTYIMNFLYEELSKLALKLFKSPSQEFCDLKIFSKTNTSIDFLLCLTLVGYTNIYTLAILIHITIKTEE